MLISSPSRPFLARRLFLADSRDRLHIKRRDSVFMNGQRERRGGPPPIAPARSSPHRQK